MIPEKGKVRCTECGWEGTEKALDRVIVGNDGSWQACPKCKMPENFEQLCDEPGCKGIVGIGTPTKDGYRWLCSKHGQPLLGRQHGEADEET